MKRGLTLVINRNSKVLNFLRNIKNEIKYHYIRKMKPNKYQSFIKREYKRQTGEKLNLENPKKYTEKMQYAKLNMNTPLKTQLTDKYLVRDWIEKKIGSEYLIPLLGVYDDFNEINFEELPEKFVLKTNHGSATNIIVEDKEKFDKTEASKKFKQWLNTDYAFYNDIQPHYSDIKPKIIVEKFIENRESSLPEFKFFCFDGQPHYCWFIYEHENERYGNIYDLDWNLQPWKFMGRDNINSDFSKPENFNELVEIATVLSKGFSHVRVDLYNVDGKVYFGEMTFTSAGGYRQITPEKYNYMLGNLWNIEG